MRNKKGQFTKGNVPLNGFKKGVVPWIKGKHHSDKSKKKMSLAKLGKPTWNKGTAIPNRKRDYMRIYESKHKKELAEYRRLWRAKHPESKHKMYLYKQQWRKDNPEREKLYQEKRKANLLEATINDFTFNQWIDLLVKYNNCCAYCGKQVAKLTQDHIIPLNNGGNHTASNIVPACGSCNCRKNDLILSEDIKSNFQLFKVYLNGGGDMNEKRK